MSPLIIPFWAGNSKSSSCFHPPSLPYISHTHSHTRAFLKTSNNSGWHLLLATWFESKARKEKSTLQTASRLLHRSRGRQRDFWRDTCFLHDLRRRWQTDASASHARFHLETWKREPTAFCSSQRWSNSEFDVVQKAHIKQSRSVSATRAEHRSVWGGLHFQPGKLLQMNKKRGGSSSFRARCQGCIGFKPIAISWRWAPTAVLFSLPDNNCFVLYCICCVWTLRRAVCEWRALQEMMRQSYEWKSEEVFFLCFKFEAWESTQTSLDLKDQSLRSDSNMKKLTSFNFWETRTGHWLNYLWV